jgi:5-methylcytosine-specific restriction endonuclease McrA
MAESGAFDGSILAYSGESEAPVDHHTCPAGRPDVGPGGETNEAVPGRASEGSIDEGHLGILGQAPTAGHESLHPQIEAKLDLRPCDLVRLLNSTPMGEVINERQLYRHRGRAGGRLGDRKKVNLLRYMGWLASNVHRTRHGPPQKKQKVADRGGVSISAASILWLLKEQRYRCALTGRALTPDTTALDHEIPVSRGGTHSIGNAQALHKDVNRAKGTLTNEEFIQLATRLFALSREQHTRGNQHES